MKSTFTVIFPSKAYRCIILHGFQPPFHITLQINPLQLFKLPLYTSHWKYFMVDCDIHVSSINHFSLYWFQQHSVIQCLALLIYISTHPILQAPIYACLWSQFLVYCDILNKYLVLLTAHCTDFKFIISTTLFHYLYIYISIVQFLFLKYHIATSMKQTSGIQWYFDWTASLSIYKNKFHTPYINSLDQHYTWSHSTVSTLRNIFPPRLLVFHSTPFFTIPFQKLQ